MSSFFLLVENFTKKSKKSIDFIARVIYNRDINKLTNEKGNEMKTLENEKCVIVYNPNYTAKTDCICGRDKTDDANMPCFYTTTVRGHKKAFEALENIFNKDTTLEKALFALRENNIKTHYWCAVD